MLTDAPPNGARSGQPAAGARRATITDVAEALGVSKGTVSRALNGYPDISDRTRQRVRQAAERMGYLPSAQAKAIRTGRVGAIGLVLQVGEPDAQRPFLADFLAGLTTAASAENCSLTIATAQDDSETRAALGRLIAERKADGFILPRTRLSDPRIDLLRAAGVPFVLFGRTGDPTGCAWFDLLGEDAMDEAVCRLHAHGHRRIGYLGGGKGLTYNVLRLEGYRRALATLGLPGGPALETHGATTMETGAAGTARLLAQSEPPTALVCATDMGALGAHRAAREAGLTVGRDLSLIGYDGVPEGAWVAPPLTTFEVDNRAAGARLAALLIRRIRGEPPEALRETARARLCPRGSDGPPALSAEALARRLAATSSGHHDTKGGRP
ncbi:MAG: LacI family DNA-binding transcriptional regulator [Paracoccaceae bacterium]|jgi:LacI family transcriptional regulator|nr:LacI family DNA-binding transcriptional regulator [Paracoccaceae bacterium]